MEKKQNSGKTRNKRSKWTKRDKVESKETRNFKDNDASWYLVNGQLASDVANFSFNNATGDRIHLDPDVTTGSGLKSTNLRLPGICSILTGPSVGIADAPTSPVNVAAKDVYSFVRHANSGHANYDAPDLMLYLLAADSVMTFWSFCVRAYGVARVYSQQNRYIGDALLSAMGLDPTDVRANLAQFRGYINQMAIKASVLAVPNTMTYFLRHQWMYQNIYMDEDNAKAQLYMYVPAYVYQYSIDATTSAGQLVPQYICASLNASGAISMRNVSLTVGALWSIGRDLIDAMLSQEDVGIMSGDILKAYGSDKLYRFAQLPDEYAIAPVFSEEVLSQFHNTEFTGSFVCSSEVLNDTAILRINPTDALTIKQDTSIGGGTLMCTPYIAGSVRNVYPKFLDFWKPDVTPEMALVASRNKIHATLINYPVYSKGGTSSTGAKGMALTTCGSEICFDAYIWFFNDNGSLTNIKVMPRLSTEDTVNILAIASGSKFNEFPLQYGVTDGSVDLPVGSMSNYAIISGQEVTAMHNAALLSLFGVPYRW